MLDSLTLCHSSLFYVNRIQYHPAMTTHSAFYHTLSHDTNSIKIVSTRKLLNNLLTSKAELIVERNFNSYLLIWLTYIDNDIVKCAETTYKRVSKLLLGG